MFPRETPIDRLTKTLKCQDAKRNTHMQDKVPVKSSGAGAKSSMKNAGTWMEVDDGILADVKVSKMERPLENREIIDSITRPYVT